MRKDLGNKMQFMPLPVLMLATYDQDGKGAKIPARIRQPTRRMRLRFSSFISPDGLL